MTFFALFTNTEDENQQERFQLCFYQGPKNPRFDDGGSPQDLFNIPVPEAVLASPFLLVLGEMNEETLEIIGEPRLSEAWIESSSWGASESSDVMSVKKVELGWTKP